MRKTIRCEQHDRDGWFDGAVVVEPMRSGLPYPRRIALTIVTQRRDGTDVKFCGLTLTKSMTRQLQAALEGARRRLGG